MAERAVLVTRPAGQAESLCQMLSKAGFVPISLPMIEIHPRDELSCVQLKTVQALDCYSHVIFVSGNAVRWGMPWIKRYWPQLPRSVSWYAVGAATARRLQAEGVRVRAPEGEMNSEGVLALPELQVVDGQRVLIIKGEGGREALAQTLLARGARVDTLCVYRRSAPADCGAKLRELLLQRRFDAVVFSSGEGLDNMLSLLLQEEREALWAVPVIVPGTRVAGLAGDRGFRCIYTARNATDEAIMETVRQRLGSE